MVWVYHSLWCNISFKWWNVCQSSLGERRLGWISVGTVDDFSIDFPIAVENAQFETCDIISMQQYHSVALSTKIGDIWTSVELKKSTSMLVSSWKLYIYVVKPKASEWKFLCSLHDSRFSAHLINSISRQNARKMNENCSNFSLKYERNELEVKFRTKWISKSGFSIESTKRRTRAIVLATVKSWIHWSKHEL